MPNETRSSLSVGLLSLAAKLFSARLALRPCGCASAASSLEHGLDELEHGALIRRRQLFDALQAFEETRGLGRRDRTHRGESQQLIGRDPEGTREIDEECTGRLRTLELIVGDHALRNAGRLPQLGLRHPAALPERGEPGPESIERLGLHLLGVSHRSTGAVSVAVMRPPKDTG